MTPTPARRFPWIVLAYLGPLAVLPLVILPLSPKLRDLRTDVSWHAWQGFLLAIVETAVLVAVTAVTAYTMLSSVPAGVTLGVVTWLLWVVVLLVHLGAIVAALSERRLEIPGISLLATRLAR